VKQGDVIAKLDTDNLELAVKQAEQALALKTGLYAGDFAHVQRLSRCRGRHRQRFVEFEAAWLAR